MSKIFVAEFEVNEDRAAQIARRLYDQFYDGKGFFKGYKMPEYILPRNLVLGSKEHAQYLTLVTSIDYMTDAVKLWRNARETYELYPERFAPSEILAVTNRTLAAFVRRLGARYPKSGALAWKRISRILLDKYDGDPRMLTPTPLGISEVKSRLTDFPYLKGGKLSNFYLRAMGENGLLKMTDFADLDIPVDIQVARFTAYTGALRLLSENYEGCIHKNPLRSLIQEVWRNAAKKIGTHPWKLDEPTWTVGSKLCSKRSCGRCPVEDLCSKTKGVRFKADVMLWERTWD